MVDQSEESCSFNAHVIHKLDVGGCWFFFFCWLQSVTAVDALAMQQLSMQQQQQRPLMSVTGFAVATRGAYTRKAGEECYSRHREQTDTHTPDTHTEWEVSGFLFYSDKTSSGQCVHCTHCQSHILQWSHLWIHLHTWTAATTRPHLLPQQTLHACIQPHIYIYWLSKSRDLKHLCSRNVSHSKCETKTTVQSLGKKKPGEKREKKIQA